MTGHYPYLMQALAVAVSRCQVWRMRETDDIFTVIEIFDFAKEWDEQHPPKEGQFYIVSIEGAIGRCYQAEWLATWLFIPMEPCAERSVLLKDMQERLAKMAEEEEKEATA